jgi:hypothetical protein
VSANHPKVVRALLGRVDAWLKSTQHRPGIEVLHMTIDTDAPVRDANGDLVLFDADDPHGKPYKVHRYVARASIHLHVDRFLFSTAGFMELIFGRKPEIHRSEGGLYVHAIVSRGRIPLAEEDRNHTGRLEVDVFTSTTEHEARAMGWIGEVDSAPAEVVDEPTPSPRGGPEDDAQGWGAGR